MKDPKISRCKWLSLSCNIHNKPGVIMDYRSNNCNAEYLSREQNTPEEQQRSEDKNHQENQHHHQQQQKRQHPRVDKTNLDQKLAYKMRALELYNRVRVLDAQRESNNRSLMLAAAGVVVLVGGAAATAGQTRVMYHAGFLVAMFGGLAELFGLVAFVKSAA